jgi:ribokinase
MTIVCVGDLMVDVVARLPGPLATGSDTPAKVTLQGGGAAANVAAWLAALGEDATFIGRVGDDTAGREAIAALIGGGVRCVVALDRERPTGMCIVLVDHSGERTMVPSVGANAGLGDDTFELPADARLVYISGYALLAPGSRPFALDAIAAARAAGVPIAVDAASSAPLAREPEFEAWVGTDVLLFANEDEARVLTGHDDPARAAQALGDRFGEAVVKCGAAGAVHSSGASVAARDVAVVDSTGAGDAFAAGYLAARLEGAAVEDALAVGVECATRAITQVGARP